MRIALENVAIEKACKLITEEELGRLWVAAKEFEKTKAEGNLVRLAEADVAFHEIIYQASDNKRLNQVLNNLREQMYRYRVEYLKDPKNYPMLVKEHDAIYRALEARNMELVTTEMHTHVANQAVAVKAVIQKQDEEKK